MNTMGKRDTHKLGLLLMASIIIAVLLMVGLKGAIDGHGRSDSRQSVHQNGDTNSEAHSLALEPGSEVGSRVPLKMTESELRVSEEVSEGTGASEYWSFTPASGPELLMNYSAQVAGERLVPAGFLRFDAFLGLENADTLSRTEAEDIFYHRYLSGGEAVAGGWCDSFTTSKKSNAIRALERGDPEEWNARKDELESILLRHQSHIESLANALRPLIKYRFDEAIMQREACVFEFGELPPMVPQRSPYRYEVYVAIGRWYFAMVVPFDSDKATEDLLQRCSQAADARDAELAAVLRARPKTGTFAD